MTSHSVESNRRIRLQLIDALLTRQGFVNREHLIRVFDMSPASASRVLREYRAMNGEGIEFNPSLKRWEVRQGFEPAHGLLRMSPMEFLAAVEKLYEVNFM